MSYQLDAIYVWAASKGLPLAHASLAAQCLQFAELDPHRQADWLAGAEVYAELARQSGAPEDIALVGAVMGARSIQFMDTDPVRSMEYRELADIAFEQVEKSGNMSAMSMAGFALAKLTDADGSDDAASARLNRIIEALGPGAATLLRETVRASDAPVSVTTKGEDR